MIFYTKKAAEILYFSTLFCRLSLDYYRYKSIIKELNANKLEVNKMKVFMIGGTGLLGSAAARIFIDRGHSVKSVALPPLPEGAPIPEEMEIVMCNIYEKTDDEIRELMAGCDCRFSPQASTRESNSPHPLTMLTTVQHRSAQETSSHLQGARLQEGRYPRFLLLLPCQRASGYEALREAPLYQKPYRPGERRFLLCR